MKEIIPSAPQLPIIQKKSCPDLLKTLPEELSRCLLSSPVFESRSAGLHSGAYYSKEASAAEVNTQESSTTGFVLRRKWWQK